MITIAIVEDDVRAAALFKELIENEELQVSAIYYSAEEALSAVPYTLLPDIFLIDIGLPKMSGIDLTRCLKSRFPDVEIIIQTVFNDECKIFEAIKAGASGYLLKTSTRDEIIRAIREVKNGGSSLSGSVARKILCEVKKGETEKTASLSEPLTEREQEVLKKLVAGLSYKAIADHFQISIHTVNSHIRHIYRKMQVTSRSEITAKMLSQTVT